MTFDLKNAGATYQRAMNYIFHELISKIVEIHIDDIVVLAQKLICKHKGLIPDSNVKVCQPI
jgi:hypothetical protein